MTSQNGYRQSTGRNMLKVYLQPSTHHDVLPNRHEKTRFIGNQYSTCTSYERRELYERRESYERKEYSHYSNGPPQTNPWIRQEGGNQQKKRVTVNLNLANPNEPSLKRQRVEPKPSDSNSNYPYSHRRPKSDPVRCTSPICVLNPDVQAQERRSSSPAWCSMEDLSASLDTLVGFNQGVNVTTFSRALKDLSL